jgi:excisionase family DNA binding protein
MTDKPTFGLALRGGDVLLDIEGARYTLLALRQYERAMAHNALELAAPLRAVMALLEKACRSGASADGSPELPQPASRAWSPALVDPLTVLEVAEMLGCSRRYVTELCAAGRFETARKVARAWQIERAEALSFVDTPVGRSA